MEDPRSRGSLPRLRDLMQRVNREVLAEEEDPDWADLQSWLEKRYIANQFAVKTSSWILNGVEGTQLARVPEAASIGKNFTHSRLLPRSRARSRT